MNNRDPNNSSKADPVQLQSYKLKSIDGPNQNHRCLVGVYYKKKKKTKSQDLLFV